MEATVEQLKQNQRMYSWLRKIYPTLTDADKEEARQIFPDVLESEDERIRDDIMDAVESCFPYERVEEIRAYLRRQKDLFIIKDVIVAIEKYLDWLTGYPDYAPKGEYSIQDMLHCLYAIEKQKEREPAGGSSEKPNSQWSEEDETCLENALWCVTKTRHFVAKDACDLDACRCAERWLESLPERLNLLPKQEWSDEDEDKVDDICKLIEHATIIPRSWDDDTGIPPTRLNDKYKGELKAFVKSFRNRPTKSDTWKPSEEQMKALNEIINILAVSMNPHENDYLFNILNGLRQSLKKL